MNESIPRRVRFGIFSADLKARELYRKNSKVKIQNQVFQVLAILVERVGQVVTREELQKGIWPGDTFVDFDEGLNASVRKLRAALGDTAENPRFVETLPRVGYRFIAPVTPEPEPPEEPSPVRASPAPPAGEGAKVAAGAVPPKPHRGLRFAGIAAVVILAAVVAAYLARQSHSGNAPPEAIDSIAVLPLENLSGDPSQEYFSDGLTDELITDLAQLTKRRVLSRTSVMGYRKTTKPAPQIARELNVDAIVEGTVERSGDRVRIRAQLVRAHTDQELWAASYDRDLRDVLGLEEEIARQIADEIQSALGLGHSVATTQLAGHRPSYEAYDQYLKGRFFWNKRTHDGFKEAVACFQDSIKDDPEYAEPYSGLADAYAMMSSYTLVPPQEYMPKARAAAQKAVALDESLAEGHTSLAIVAENYDWDLKTAEREYRRAIELNPSYATAHQWYAELLAFEGRFDEALAESDRARQLDPLSVIIAADNGAALYYARHYDRAIERLRTILEMDPAFSRALIIVGAYVETGQSNEALKVIQNWRRKSGDVSWSLAWKAYVYGRTGKTLDAQRTIRSLKLSLRNSKGDPAPMFAFIYAGMNDREQSIAWLQKAYQEHLNYILSLQADPAYDSIRGDPRFQDLVRRVGLVPSGPTPPGY